MLFRSIGEKAFQMCANLQNINLGNITSLDKAAFAYCDSLTTVDLSSLTTMELGAFMICPNLKTVTLGNSITSIGEGAFSACTALQSINLSNVTSIGEKAFMLCESLITINLSNLSYPIEPQTFLGCSALETVTLGTKITEIGEGAFGGCEKLETINLENITSIGGAAFGLCPLKSITLGKNITTIGHGAFAHTALTSIVIPASVNELGSYLFSAPEAVGGTNVPSNLNNIVFEGTTVPNMQTDTFYQVNPTGTVLFPKSKAADYIDKLRAAGLTNLDDGDSPAWTSQQTVAVTFNFNEGIVTAGVSSAKEMTSGTPINVRPDTSVKFTITPPSGKLIDSVTATNGQTVLDADITNGYYMLVSNDTTVTITFKNAAPPPITYATLNFNIGEGGSVNILSPLPAKTLAAGSSALTVVDGSNVIFTTGNPDPRLHAVVMVNTTELMPDADGQYTIASARGNQTITISYVDPHEPSVVLAASTEYAAHMATAGQLIVRFSELMDVDSAGTVTLNDQPITGGTWSVATDDPTQSIYTIGYDHLMPGTEYAFAISGFMDEAQNTMHDYTAAWQTTPAPAILTTAFSDAHTSGSVQIKFSKPMDATAGSIKLDGHTLTGNWIDPQTYELAYQGLANGETYKLIASAFTDESLAGSNMIAETSITLTTLPLPEPEEIDFPDVGTDDKPEPTGIITIDFGREMNPDEGEVMIGGRPCKVTWSDDNTVATIHYENLNTGTEYTLDMRGFKDIDGAEMKPYEKTFTTEGTPPPPIIIPPQTTTEPTPTPTPQSTTSPTVIDPTPSPMPTPQPEQPEQPEQQAQGVRAMRLVYLVRGTTVALPHEMLGSQDASATWHIKPKSAAFAHAADGRIKAKKSNHSVDMVVTIGEHSATTRVRSVNRAVPVKKVGISLGHDTLMHVGDSLEIKTAWRPTNATNVIPTFRSSDPSVVSASSMGTLTAHAPGTATITIRIGQHQGTRTVTITE